LAASGIVLLQRNQRRNGSTVLGDDRGAASFGRFEQVWKLITGLLGSFAGGLAHA
jgi:hypothetical protein